MRWIQYCFSYLPFLDLVIADLFLYCYERDFMSDIHFITQLLRLTSHAMNPILLFLFTIFRSCRRGSTRCRIEHQNEQSDTRLWKYVHFSVLIFTRTNFDIHFSMKRQAWLMSRLLRRLFWIPHCCVFKNEYFIAKTEQFWYSINIRIEFYLFVSYGGMKDRGSKDRATCITKFTRRPSVIHTSMRNKQVEFNP